MAKALDAPYEAGRRGRRWLKVKPVRTLDLVVLAAEWGHGRRPRLAQQPPPRRARSGAGRLRDARQDLQGHDRRDAGVADDEAAGARGLPRRPHRLRAPRAGGGGGVQRPAGEPAVSRRPRPAIRAGQGLPAGQDRPRTRTRSRRSGRSGGDSRAPEHAPLAHRWRERYRTALACHRRFPTRRQHGLPSKAWFVPDSRERRDRVSKRSTRPRTRPARPRPPLPSRRPPRRRRSWFTSPPPISSSTCRRRSPPGP